MTRAEDEDGSESRGWKRRNPEDILEAMHPGEPYMTGELADLLGWPQRSTYHVLEQLVEDGKVRKKKPDPRRAIWMLTNGGE